MQEKTAAVVLMTGKQQCIRAPERGGVTSGVPQGIMGGVGPGGRKAGSDAAMLGRAWRRWRDSRVSVRLSGCE